MQEKSSAEEAVCQRCAETYIRAVVRLRTVFELGKVRESERVAKLVKLEGLTPSAAESWLKHNMHMSCEKRVAYCSQCGGQLTTWQAKWCQHCKHDWH